MQIAASPLSQRLTRNRGGFLFTRLALLPGWVTKVPLLNLATFKNKEKTDETEYEG